MRLFPTVSNRTHMHRMAGLAMVTLAVGCGARSGLNVDDSAYPELGNNVAVRVVNDNYYSARVRAVYEGGGRYIIGTVPSHKTADDFLIPWQPKLLLFEIDLVVGPGVYLSDRLLVEPGDLVELRLPPDLERSGFFRRISGDAP